jgi:hypothetical protein
MSDFTIEPGFHEFIARIKALPEAEKAKMREQLMAEARSGKTVAPAPGKP